MQTNADFYTRSGLILSHETRQAATRLSGDGLNKKGRA